MLTKELVNEAKVVTAITTAAGAAGTSDLNGASLDMANFEGVLATVAFGPIVSGAATSVKAQQSADGSTWADLAGTSQTVADDADNTTVYLSLHKPAKRYVRVVVARGTQNATVGAATYLQYGSRTLPVTQTASGEKFVSPLEGTA